jgi:hypothetical protein
MLFQEERLLKFDNSLLPNDPNVQRQIVLSAGRITVDAREKG